MKETNKKITCASCGKVLSYTFVMLVNPGFDDEMYVCSECLSDCFQCGHCGRYYTRRHEWATDSGFTICTHCESNYEICSCCSEILHRNNTYFYNNEPYCSPCYEDRVGEDRGSYIEDYGYKPEPVFLGECADNLYLGVELEVDGGKSFDASKDLSQKFTDVYLKHDGSLESGFEIVSHPATLHYHKYDLGWEYIMHTCLTHRMFSHETSTCGLHCHVSRSFFGETCDEQDLHIAKLILLINKFWDTHIVPFSRRHIGQLDRWAAKPILDLEENDTEAQIIDKVKDTKYRGRYQGINLTNYDTVEFRIFRGTLNLNTFIATLQFVDCICRFAKAMKLSGIYTVNWSDLFSGKEDEYPELMSYLKSKDLI